MGAAWIGIRGQAATGRAADTHHQAVGADALLRERLAQLAPTGLDQRPRGGVLGAHVQLERAELGHLSDHLRVVHRLEWVLVLELGHEQLQEVLLSEV